MWRNSSAKWKTSRPYNSLDTPNPNKDERTDGDPNKLLVTEGEELIAEGNAGAVGTSLQGS